MVRLEKALAAEGRSRADITVTACPYFNPFTPEMVDQYAEAGVDQVTALFFAMSPTMWARRSTACSPCSTAPASL